jgi:thiol-disulfide isomerase/thioredoxin/uncharacterized membrane protein YphA (DoxX/SURF4 family)
VTPIALGIVPGLMLAVVFAAAGVTKLSDRAGTRDAVGAFGVPERLAGSVALSLPVAELTVATLMLFGSTRVAGAAGALALLVLFIVVIAANLARGRRPECHCFGQLHSAPAGWKTLARNAGLAILALVVLVLGHRHPGASAIAWVGKLDASELLALSAGFGVLGLAIVGGLAFTSLLRSHGRVLLRLDAAEAALRMAGLEVTQDDTILELGRDPGTPAPEFTAETADGGRTSLADLLEPGLPLVLTFTSPDCGPCRALLPAISRWQHEHAGILGFATVSAGKREAIRADAKAHELEQVLVDDDFALYEAYQANGTPSAVLISADGHIAAYLASGAEAIEQLVQRAVDPAEEDEHSGLAVGSPAPELDLRDLAGERVSLADPDGRDTLVLFWNPGCGFCGSMLSDVLAWEQNAGPGSPRLLVVSSGSADESRSDGFQSVVALDPDYSAGEAFGAGGTPMAVLLDGQGRVASALAAGGGAVMALAAAPGIAKASAGVEATR